MHRRTRNESSIGFMFNLEKKTETVKIVWTPHTHMIRHCSSRRARRPQSRLDKQEVLNLFSICLLLYTQAVKVSPSVCRSADRGIIEQPC